MLQLQRKELNPFPLKVQIQSFLRQSKAGFATVEPIILGLSKHYLEGKSFDEAFLRFVDICFTIDKIKVHVLGLNGPTLHSNYLMKALASRFAAVVPLTYQNVEGLATLAQNLEKTEGEIGWLFPKVHILMNECRRSLQAAAFAASCTVDPIAGALMEKARAELKDHADVTKYVMHELFALRKYGVKASYFQDGFFHASQEAWVFLDYIEFDKVLADMHKFQPSVPLAFLGLTTLAELARIGTEPTSRGERGVSMRGVRVTFEGTLFATLDREGELDASLGSGFLPLRPFFERCKKEAEYEALRLTQAMRLFDLVVPIMAVEKLPNKSIRIPGIGRMPGKVLPNPDLVVPRVRLLETQTRMREELEQELDEADDVTSRRQQDGRRAIIYHERRLPQGKRPSPEARERAATYGIVLAENETFVRPHERGEGELVHQVHRAVKR